MGGCCPGRQAYSLIGEEKEPAKTVFRWKKDRNDYKLQPSLYHDQALMNAAWCQVNGEPLPAPFSNMWDDVRAFTVITLYDGGKSVIGYWRADFGPVYSGVCRAKQARRLTSSIIRSIQLTIVLSPMVVCVSAEPPGVTTAGEEHILHMEEFEPGWMVPTLYELADEPRVPRNTLCAPHPPTQELAYRRLREVLQALDLQHDSEDLFYWEMGWRFLGRTRKKEIEASGITSSLLKGLFGGTSLTLVEAALLGKPGTPAQLKVFSGQDDQDEDENRKDEFSSMSLEEVSAVWRVNNMELPVEISHYCNNAISTIAFTQLEEVDALYCLWNLEVSNWRVRDARTEGFLSSGVQPTPRKLIRFLLSYLLKC